MENIKNLTDLKNALTEKEFQMLEKIVDAYNDNDAVCYDKQLTSSEKGVVGSLVKKGIVYDSYEYESYEESNLFPINEVLDIFGVEHNN